MLKFQEIECIEEVLEKEDVFDITVEKTHNFFANGILVHNCLGGTLASQYWEHMESGEDAVLNGIRESCQQFKDIFGDRFYAELQWNAIPHQHKLNTYIIQVAQELGIELISTTDSHYPKPELWKDRLLYKELGWLNYKSDEKKSLPSSVNEVGYELYPKNGDQMWQDYKKYSALNGVSYDDDLIMESIERTHNIAFSRIENFYPETSVRLPDFIVPEGANPDQLLKEKCYFGLAKLGINNPKYNERLDYELGVIARNGFSKYFLTMDAIHQEASRMVLTGPGRGCFIPGSRVLMADGLYAPIETIQVGEKVIDAYGQTQKVGNTFSYDVDEELVELEFDDGSIIVCTKDHKLLLCSGEWVQADNIIENTEIKDVCIK